MEPVDVPSGGVGVGVFYADPGSAPASAAPTNPPNLSIPSISLEKSASISSYSAAGTLVTYSYTVTNTGDVTLNPVTVTDPMPGLSPISCPATTLSPAANETCTATYTTTQADVDRGSLQTTGTATGTPPSGPDVTAQSSVSIPALQTPSILVVKSADVPSVSTVGQLVTYTFKMENTGNVTLSGVRVSDAQTSPSLDSSLGAITCVTGTNGNITLAPGATDMCSATYTVTQADLTNNSVTDTATVTGQPPNQLPPVTGTSTVTLLVASVSVVKSAAPSGGVVAGSATPVVYTLTVTNTGSAATTAPIVVTDAAPPGTTLVAGSPACATGGAELHGCGEQRHHRLDDPGGREPRCVLHAHVPGDGRRDHCNGDHHQHSLVERPGMRPARGGAGTTTSCPTNTVTTPVTAPPTLGAVTTAVIGSRPPPVTAPSATPSQTPSTTGSLAFTGAPLGEESMWGVTGLLLGAAMVASAGRRRRGHRGRRQAGLTQGRHAARSDLLWVGPSPLRIRSRCPRARGWSLRPCARAASQRSRSDDPLGVVPRGSTVRRGVNVPASSSVVP